MEFEQALGENIRTFRQAAGLTQQKLGELCGYNRNCAERMVQFWESGERKPPITKLRDLANALGSTIDSIIP